MISKVLDVGPAGGQHGRRLLVLLGERGRPFPEQQGGGKVAVLCSEIFRIRQNLEGFDIFRIRLSVVKASNS